MMYIYVHVHVIITVAKAKGLRGGITGNWSCYKNARVNTDKYTWHIMYDCIYTCR